MSTFQTMDAAKAHINALFVKKEPWQIVTITTSSTLLIVWLYQFLTKEESKRNKFIIPLISNKIKNFFSRCCKSSQENLFQIHSICAGCEEENRK